VIHNETAELGQELTSAGRQAGVQIAVIVPTFKEAQNVPVLVERLAERFGHFRWEVIFVDDNSPDGTSDVVISIARRCPPVRLLFRPSRRGLSSAVIEGIFATTAEYVVVMDGDLQHDESIIPEMIEALRSTDAKLVIGSRHAAGGGNEGMTDTRRRISDWSNRLARLALGRDVGDLMSGFFAFRRDDIAPIAARLNGSGFKILLDILFRMAPDDKVVEVPYVFRERASGSSKLGFDAASAFVMMIAERFLGRLVSQRFLKFCMVGTLGVGFHFLILSALLNVGKLEFTPAHLLATLGAATTNFYFNNRWTYGEMTLRGSDWFVGLLKFLSISAVGIFANVGVASAVHGQHVAWQLSAISGIAIGVFWNYMMTKIAVWKT
jgi:dolichol-phosphate mannosyltransferase